MSNLKAYILVKEDYDIGRAMNSVAHAGTLILLHWDKEEPIINEWLSGLYRKVTCKVTDEEFERAKTESLDWFVVTESSLDHKEVVLCFKPRTEWSKFFKYLRLYR